MIDDPHPFSFHFFVSYTTREDEVKALLPTLEHFARELKARGFEGHIPFWFDRIAIGKFEGSDDELRCTLAHGINHCTAMIGFISPGYIESHLCKFEWAHMARSTPPMAPLSFQLPIIWKSLDHKDHWLIYPNRTRDRSPISFVGVEDESHPRRHLSWDRAIEETCDFIVQCHHHRLRRWHPSFKEDPHQVRRWWHHSQIP